MARYACCDAVIAACVEAMGITARIVDFSGTKILVRTINGALDESPLGRGSSAAAGSQASPNVTLLMSAGETGAQFDVLVPKFNADAAGSSPYRYVNVAERRLIV